MKTVLSNIRGLHTVVEMVQVQYLYQVLGATGSKGGNVPSLRKRCVQYHVKIVFRTLYLPDNFLKERAHKLCSYGL